MNQVSRSVSVIGVKRKIPYPYYLAYMIRDILIQQQHQVIQIFLHLTIPKEGNN